MLIIDCEIEKINSAVLLRGLLVTMDPPPRRPRFHCRTSSSCNKEAKSNTRREEKYHHFVAFGRQTWRPRGHP